MKKRFLAIIAVFLWTACLSTAVRAAEEPGIIVTQRAVGEGTYEIQVTLSGIPEDDPVEYVQILLKCSAEASTFPKESFSLAHSEKEWKVTCYPDERAGQLLILIEPVSSKNPGIGNGLLFQVSQECEGQTAPELELEGILILRGGRDYEIAQRLQLQTPSQPDPTEPEPEIPSTEPSAGETASQESAANGHPEPSGAVPQNEKRDFPWVVFLLGIPLAAIGVVVFLKQKKDHS